MNTQKNDMTAIIDYGAGNTRSVMNVLDRLGCKYVLTSDIEEISTAQRLILPGVGHAAPAMKSLQDRSLIEVIKGYKKPFLGICLGMQLMCSFSEEGETSCLGLIGLGVKKLLPSDGLKVPHMGWNKMSIDPYNPLFMGLEAEEYVYFVHSYAVPCSDATIGTCDYSGSFSAAIQKNNFFGVQFHPEKSGIKGQLILHNFLKLT
jgi:imidazole glycerol-phosphate synthase subunit HisH